MKKYGWVLAGLLSALLLLSCASSAPLALWYRADGPFARGDGGAVIRAAGVTLNVEEIGGSARLGLLQDLAGVQIDPFDVSRDGEPLFRTFELKIHNQGQAILSYSPSFSRLDIGAYRRYPLGFTELYSFLKTAFREEAQVMRCAKLFEETPVRIAPGDSATRLLVFNRLEPNTAEVALELTGFKIGDRPIGARIEFTRVIE